MGYSIESLCTYNRIAKHICVNYLCGALKTSDSMLSTVGVNKDS